MHDDIKLWVLSAHWDGDFASGDAIICNTKEECIQEFHNQLERWNAETYGEVSQATVDEAIKADSHRFGTDAEYTIGVDDNGFPTFEYNDGDYTTAHMSITEISLTKSINSISII